MIMNDIEKMIGLLRYAADCIYLVEKHRNDPTCNNCGAPKECMFRPEWGEHVRINCPHWKRGEEK